MIKKVIRVSFLVCIFIFIIGIILPENFVMPVLGARKKDYNQESFWYHPWGKSVTHKGVDIFSKKGTKIVSSTPGIVVLKGRFKTSGNALIILGPKWRIHYYAHLDQVIVKKFSFISTNTIIGTVGDSGNAKGKPAHLHYTIATLIPYFWLKDDSLQGWKKMFYLNPVEKLNHLFYR